MSNLSAPKPCISHHFQGALLLPDLRTLLRQGRTGPAFLVWTDVRVQRSTRNCQSKRGNP